MRSYSISPAIIVASLSATPLRGDDPKLKLDGEKFTYGEGAKAIRGILVKPSGKGPFPAILISHGLGGNAERFAPKARDWVRWGFVCIACDYTHSDAQGDRKTFGASEENLRRAKACLDLLAAMPEADAKRVCAYGNSMGAYLTIGLAAEEPKRLVAAAITAGGINAIAGFAAPSKEQAAKIKTPFLILHGTKDTTVPPERSELLSETLKANKVEHERITFDGVGHDLHTAKAKEVNAKIEEWSRTTRKQSEAIRLTSCVNLWLLRPGG
jgi:dienelactone hydrolase